MAKLDEDDIKKHLNVISFSEEIERIVKYEKTEGYMEAIVHFCSKNGLEVEEIVKFVSESLKQKLAIEAQEAGLIRASSKPAWTF